VNNIAHCDLSWFRPLLEGNSPTSNRMILKMKVLQRGEKSAREVHVVQGEWISCPLLEG
jgi:hypothetical protein